ncbi:MAG TPA: TonB-dependent receptor [Pseudomonadales bacterium]
MSVKKFYTSCKSSRFLISTLSAAITSILAATANTAIAQENAADLEEITVTGSRIRQTSGFETPTPVTAITTDEMFEFAPGNNIARQLSALPQFFGNVSMQNVSTGQVATSGTSSLNLRSLGGNRTLVLLDGIRVVPAAKDGLVNVDAFPTALMRSVDVVTGGASAAYGADAVGGVVNFVLDRTFEGFTMDIGTGMNEFGDGEMWNISMAGGKSFMDDRLNVIGSIEAREIDQIQRTASEVPEMTRMGLVTNPAWRASDPPGTNPRQITRPWVASTASSPYGLIIAPGTPLDRMRFTPDGRNITPFILGDVSSVSGPGSTQSTSGGPDAMLSNDAFGGGIGGTGNETQSAFGGVQYQFTDSFSVFGQAMYGRTDASNTSDRGGALLYSIWAPSIAVDNAYLPENVRQAMIANNLQTIAVHKNGNFTGLNEPGFNRTDSKVMEMTSFATGFDWDVGFRDWHLRGVWQEGKSKREAEFGQLWRVDRTFLAMDAVRDPNTGAIVCRVQTVNPTPAQLAASPSVANLISPRSAPGAVRPGDPGALPVLSPIGLDNTVSGCVPFNVMGAGNMSQAALDYVNGTPKRGFGEVEQSFGELLLTGEAFEGWGAGPIGFAAGLTTRDQSFWDDAGPYEITALSGPRNDPALGIRGIPSGYTTSSNMHYISTLPIISGDAKVWEYFGELDVPLWAGTMFGQDQTLGTDFAFRRSDYDRSGPVDSWKFGANYQVTNDLRLRYTKSRDVREPTFSELFDAQGTNGSFLDARNGNREVQVTTVSGGNPNLAPEEADTVTAGFVYTPTNMGIDGVQLSVDWYDIQIRGAVSQLGAQRIADECFIRNNASLCAQMQIAADGTVTRMNNVFLNVAQARVRGIDYELAYTTEPNFFGDEDETFTLRMLAGYVAERSDTPLGGTPLDVSGGLQTPELTSVLTGNYRVGPWGFMLQGRFQDESIINTLWTEGVDVDKNTVPPYTWWSGMVSYSGETASGSTYRIGLNVQNLFDKGPNPVPNVSTRFAIQGLTGDLYGRRYNLNVNYSF